MLWLPNVAYYLWVCWYPYFSGLFVCFENLNASGEKLGELHLRKQSLAWINSIFGCNLSFWSEIRNDKLMFTSFLRGNYYNKSWWKSVSSSLFQFLSHSKSSEFLKYSQSIVSSFELTRLFSLIALVSFLDGSPLAHIRFASFSRIDIHHKFHIFTSLVLS